MFTAKPRSANTVFRSLLKGINRILAPLPAPRVTDRGPAWRKSPSDGQQAATGPLQPLVGFEPLKKKSISPTPEALACSSTASPAGAMETSEQQPPRANANKMEQQAESQPPAEPKNNVPKPMKGRKSKHALRRAAAEAEAMANKTATAAGAAAKALRPQDSIRPPSAESGGVPEPTVQYLLQAQAPSRPLPEPRRIFVVMDLNGTLLHRPSKRRPFHFVERPHAKAFINYCLDNFYVAIWSSARPDNVEKMVSRLLTPEQVGKCLLVWGRDKFGLTTADYDDRVQCYKRLTRVWTDPRIVESYPNLETGGRWDQTNTVLVDDSREKARSEPHNLLQIPDFVGLDSEPLHVLPQVHDYLNSLCHQSNLSAYIKENPFKLDPAYKLAD